MKPLKIHQFDPVIYPRLVWIVNGGTPEDIRKEFFERDGEELNLEPEFKNSHACVSDVTFGEDKMIGVLVWIIDKPRGCKDIAHESVHVANKIFRDCGIDMHYDHDEHYAYLIGWVADCIEQVVKNKFKDR